MGVVVEWVWSFSWGDEKSSVEGWWDGCTTRRMYLMLLNNTREMVKMVNFTLCDDHN